jgi:hypothetical protein
MAYHTRRICISNRIHRRFIPVSFVKHPFPEQFSWFATSVQRNLPSFDPAFRPQIRNASV